MSKNNHITVRQKYDEAFSKMAEEFDIKNPMALPRLSKVVVNVGTGDKLRDKSKKEALIKEFSAISGQTPKIQPARISVSGFAVREGMPVGLTATLRKDRMFNFLDKLISITLPRLRDFRGVSTTSFDKAGNYTLGLSEHTVFPEIDLASVERPHGLEITIVIKNSDKEKSRKYLEFLGMPFAKEE